MGKFKFIVAAIVVVGLGLILAWQRASNEGLRRENDGLKETLTGLRQLSDMPTPAASDNALSDEQQAELLKLRAEVTQLREQTNQIGALADANQKLQVSLREARATRTSVGGGGGEANKKKPEDALPQDIHPKDSWAFRGYGSPDATMESILKGMLVADKAAILEGFSPEMRAEIEQQMNKGNFEEDIKKMNFTEFRVLDRRQLSDDEMAVTVYTTRNDANGDPTGNTETTVFQKIGGEWKVTKKRAPEN